MANTLDTKEITDLIQDIIKNRFEQTSNWVIIPMDLALRCEMKFNPYTSEIQFCTEHNGWNFYVDPYMPHGHLTYKKDGGTVQYATIEYEAI